MIGTVASAGRPTMCSASSGERTVRSSWSRSQASSRPMSAPKTMPTATLKTGLGLIGSGAAVAGVESETAAVRLPLFWKFSAIWRLISERDSVSGAICACRSAAVATSPTPSASRRCAPSLSISVLSASSCASSSRRLAAPRRCAWSSKNETEKSAKRWARSCASRGEAPVAAMRISSVSLTTDALTRWSSEVAVRPPPRLAAAAARKPRSLTCAV